MPEDRSNDAKGAIMTTIDAVALARSFEATFAGTIILPEAEGYDAARSLWNATTDGRPALIARCHSTTDVAAAVKLTRSAGVPLAIRAGGHSLAGLSTCDGGVVIDLSTWRGVDVDPDRRVAVVDPGATWADVDAAGFRHGLATTGGLISTTGVAGLTLGGGIGWLQRRFGLACDNLRAAEVVTADGEVIEADEDLLWGLRGGGGNFGVVTRFQFELHPVATVLGGLLAFPLERGEEVLRAFREWSADAPEEATLLVAIMSAPPEPFVPPQLVGQKVVALLGCWCGEDEAGEAALGPLRALGPALDQFGPMPYPALQSMLDGAAPHGLRNYYRGGYVAELDDEVVATALKHGERLPSLMSQIHFHQMGGAVGRFGTDTSAFSGRAAGYTYNLISTWTDPADDPTHIAANNALSADLAPRSMAGTYVNFASESDFGRVRAAYGDAIYDRLAGLKRKYDPANVFCRNQNVQPAR